MSTTFMNSKNSQTSDYHSLVLKLTDKMDSQRGNKCVALSDLTIYYTVEEKKVNLKYQEQHGINNLN